MSVKRFLREKAYLSNAVNLVKEDKMKKLVIVLTVLFAFSVSAYSQMGGGMMGEQKGEMKQPGKMMGDGQRMPMMNQEMMQMMMDMLNMQEKMMMGMKPEEKKKMMKDMGQMKEKMSRMMSMHMNMMMGAGDPQAKFKCAETWLKKAIDLHEVHLKDPRTATEASQMEMMDQMKKAYGCITEMGARIKSVPPKAPAAGEKKDAHGH
ncbi:MAG: hypothetical protein HZA15_14895 [Nitrospirae bacterium]|nr:hypothetical protein [Nitrospirota bacterium]